MPSHARLTVVTAAAGVLFLSISAPAQQLEGQKLVNALRQGGYVIVMRHASSPREVPDAKSANPDNPKPERQLDQEGRASATALGKALRDLKIPLGSVFTSPTYRAIETIRYAKLGTPQPEPALGDNGQSMQGGTDAQAAWLKKKVTEFPKGTNTLVVTHMPNMSRAFPENTANLA
ncbi:MAG TPA: histidine phosphatase family protein, partial [Bryobacteraceae bacterium]